MNRIGDYQLLERIEETRGSVIYRGRKDGSDGTVIVKVLKAAFPTSSEKARFRHEYRIIKGLDFAGVIRTFDFLEYGNSFALVLEDFQGISLKRLIESGPLTLDSFLAIAVALADTLGSIHERGIIHRDIKPHNILVNGPTLSVKITDFGISSEITHDKDELYATDIVEGTLAYLSPEQTGRMNRSVDYRTDLYSLGVTLYELLCGTVPFRSSDPMEIIHSHIARRPIPPISVKATVPPVISDIVLRLLAKNAEERYQNSFGLLADLQQCAAEWSTRGAIASFVLGSNDVSPRFNIPQALVGRDTELARLLAAFGRAAVGRFELLLVAGNPGIGKSALVNEIHKPITARRGYFIAGKYEQFRRDVPYNGIIQAFQTFLRQLLMEGERQIYHWRETLAGALGDSGRVITDVIPALELIIGRQPDIPVLPPQESHNRFTYVFRNFIGAFARSEHPLTVFLDDLQWADAASINLLAAIAREHTDAGLLVIGSYRDNEIDASHPLALAITDLVKAGVAVDTIQLGPLRPEHVTAFAGNFMRCPGGQIADLAAIIHEKTGGNPFFINQFMKTLYEQRIIEPSGERDASGLYWHCDIEAVRNMQVTDNVVELMAGKIAILPERTRRVLMTGACIGNRFSLETLAPVLGMSIDDALADLTDAMTANLVVPQGDLYTFYHDRIQEAAYSLLDEGERVRIHHDIGAMILDSTPEAELNDRVFFIVNHLNRGVSLVTGLGDRERLARLNFMAGRKARESAAFSSAGSYLAAGIALLGDAAWTDTYELSFPLHMLMAECEYLTGNFSGAEERFTMLLERAGSTYDRARIYDILVVLYTHLSRLDDAINAGLRGLALFGRKIPVHPSPVRIVTELIKARVRMRGRDSDQLLSWRPMTDREKMAQAKLLESIANPAGYMNQNLMILVLLKQLNLSLVSGFSQYTPSSLLGLGAVNASVFKNIDAAYRYGKLALAVNQKYPNRLIQSKIEFLFGWVIQHWKEPLTKSIETYRRAYEHALEAGNLIFAGHSLSIYFISRALGGENIDDVLDEYVRHEDFFRRIGDPFIFQNYEDNRQLLLCLQGKTAGKLSFSSGDYVDEERTALLRREPNQLHLFNFLSYKCLICWIQGEHRMALPILEELIGLSDIANSFPHYPQIFQEYVMAAAGVYHEVSRTEKRRLKRRMRRYIRMMKAWARHCRTSFENRRLIMDAELARIEGRSADAIRLYRDAIAAAREAGSAPSTAMNLEHAAIFYLELGHPEVARPLIMEARAIYAHWGAAAKIRTMDGRYASLIQSLTIESREGTASLTSGTHHTTTSSDVLDISTVMKAARTISGEIILEKLLQKLISLVIENAGAQHGFLILDTKGVLTIEARGSIDSGMPPIIASQPLDQCPDLSAAIVHLVARSRETVIVHDALGDEVFSRDPSIQARQPKSILCMPVINQGQLTGVLYLENNLSTYAFVPSRVRLLEVMAVQAAVSLENARLYAEMEDRVHERTGELRQAMTALESMNDDLSTSNRQLKLSQDIASRDMEMAVNVQTNFLPQEAPRTSDWDVAYRYRPMAGVSGDFYDFYYDDDSFDGVGLWDVSGHGIASGLITMIAKSIIFRSFTRGKDQPLHVILDRVNRQLQKEIGTVDNYITGVLLRFAGDRVEYVNAGHGDIFIRSGGVTGPVRRENGESITGLFLGITGIDGIAGIDDPYEELSFPMKGGDMVLLFTDCLSESKNDRGAEYGIDRILASFARAPSSSADEAVEALLGDFYAFLGRDCDFNDDLTVIILHRRTA